MTIKLNSKNTCLVCFKEGNLVEHYVSFDAKIICYVHNECHKKIHDGQRPDLMHYQEKDSTKSCLKKIQTYKQKKKKVLGSRLRCYVCKEEPETEFELIKHHIQYFPEVTCFVHYKCHTEIHDGKYPKLIQYEDGDSRKFYEKLKGVDKTYENS